MYRNNDIPEGYNKIAEFSDNYLVWVRESSLSSGTSYNAYIQYLTPSDLVIFIDNYKIKSGTSYTLDANYIYSGGFSYLDSYDVSYSLTTMSADVSFSQNFYDRSDAPLVFIVAFLHVIAYVWIINQLSKLFKKGGVFTS